MKSFFLELVSNINMISSSFILKNKIVEIFHFIVEVKKINEGIIKYKRKNIIILFYRKSK